ncbi:DUF6221 family protein [Streptomyces sp. NBC_00989]|uniref:DUF6221 family protein n=1 Tax=Streptomyces sp. NBC_00989 TaxID=2903705 RepID=UPI002F91584C|nr:DUF6221 family protein [Streptomyces sp. NBC_00989]
MRAKSSTDELITFVRARLAETASQAELFHELVCPAVASGEPGARTAVLEGCVCPVPRQILDRVRALRSVLGDCEQRIRCQDPQDPKWPLDPVFAAQTLRALALPFELHPQWQDAWLPG